MCKKVNRYPKAMKNLRVLSEMFFTGSEVGFVVCFLVYLFLLAVRAYVFHQLLLRETEKLTLKSECQIFNKQHVICNVLTALESSLDL